MFPPPNVARPPKGIRLWMILIDGGDLVGINVTYCRIVRFSHSINDLFTVSESSESRLIPAQCPSDARARRTRLRDLSRTPAIRTVAMRNQKAGFGQQVFVQRIPTRQEAVRFGRISALFARRSSPGRTPRRLLDSETQSRPSLFNRSWISLSRRSPARSVAGLVCTE